MNKEISLCLITKNKFYLNENYLVSSGLLTYHQDYFIGFRFEEFKKILFIGFNEEKEFDGYCYKNLGRAKNVFVVGPKFKEEKKYILDRLVNIFKILLEIWKKRKTFKDAKIVFSPFFEYSAFIFLFLKIINPQAKFILYIIGDYPELNYFKKRNIFYKIGLLWLQKLSFLISNQIWFISDFLYRKYKTTKGILVRLSSIKEEDIGVPKHLNKNFNLLFVGRLAEEKRPYLAFLVHQKLLNKGLKSNLLVIGDGPLRDALKDFKLPNVLFTGWIKDRNELINYYKKADFLIFPSTQGEGFGLVILEAMSQGVVVLSTKSGGPEEIIEDKKNGFLFELEDDEQITRKMAEKIEYLIQNPEIYCQASKKAIETVKDYTIEKFSKIQREIILKLLKK